MNPDTCEARLYETALVILPRKSYLLRIPYSYFARGSQERLQT